MTMHVVDQKFLLDRLSACHRHDSASSFSSEAMKQGMPKPVRSQL
jgi:hypothetical protein